MRFGPCLKSVAGSSRGIIRWLAVVGVLSRPEAARAAGDASDPTAAPESVQADGRSLAALSGGGQHLVVYPALFPSALALTYGGIRIGAVSQSENYRPFATTADTFDQVSATAAFDVEKLIAKNLAVVASAVGNMSTGVTVGTLVANGATVGGGFDVGLQGGCAPRSWLRFGIVGTVGQRFGESLLFERAVPAIDVNIVSESAKDAATTIGEVAGNIPVPYVDAIEHLDVTGLFVPLKWLSIQADIGFEHQHRYYRTSASSTVGVLGGDDVEQAALHFGAAAEVDFDSISPKTSRNGGHVPLALVVEYAWSPNRVAYSTVADAANHPTLTLWGYSDAFAASVHYASAASPDLDAALTFLYGWSELPSESAVLQAGTPDAAHSLGGQIMARYLW